MEYIEVDGQKYRYLLYHLGYGQDEDAAEPLRSAILDYDRFVVPLIMGKEDHPEIRWEAALVNQLVVGLLEQEVSEEVVVKLINLAIEQMTEDVAMEGK